MGINFKQMRKIIIILIIVLSYSLSGNAQKSIHSNLSGLGLGTEVFLSYARTMYSFDNHTQTGFVPVGVRGYLIPMEKLELGGEIQFNLLSPTYELKHPFTDEVAYTEKYRFNYFGIFARFYPVENLVFARLGFGFNFNNRIRTIYTDDYLKQEPYLDDKRVSTSYTNAFGFNFGAGVYLGEDNGVALSLIYNYKKNKLPDVIPEDDGYNASYFAFCVSIAFKNM